MKTIRCLRYRDGNGDIACIANDKSVSHARQVLDIQSHPDGFKIMQDAKVSYIVYRETLIGAPYFVGVKND